MNNIELVARILAKYQIDKNVSMGDITDLKVHKAQQYALTKILSFNYKDRKFYISDDYSLGDNPLYVKDLIQDINHLLGGNIVKNPIAQSDGTLYALGLNGVEYYLWEDRT
jgi:hypothetical protein